MSEEMKKSELDKFITRVTEGMNVSFYNMGGFSEREKKVFSKIDNDKKICAQMYKDSVKEDKKFYILGYFAPGAVKLYDYLKNYIASIELFDKDRLLEKKHIELSTLPEKIDENIYVKEYKEFRAVFIRFKDDNGNNIDDYINLYMQISDNRTYSGAVYNMIQYVETKHGATPDNKTHLPHNLLLSGAPGTGKSYYLNQSLLEAGESIINNMIVQDKSDKDEHVKRATAQRAYLESSKYVKRVTFYEDYSYESFVGCYKPMPESDDITQIDFDGKTGHMTGNKVIYKYEPGPFITTYINAINNEESHYYLVVEEINRAKAASVFGDMFQLLDRKDGESVYAVTPEPALDKYLREILGVEYNGTMRLPRNMYIWATMNSADQGVFPLDAAFKRRWTYKYMNIKQPRASKGDPIEIAISLRWNDEVKYAKWDDFRGMINHIILKNNMEEDRCIGPWYFSDSELLAIEAYNKSNSDERLGMCNPLLDKLFLYLRQDVFRNAPSALFCDIDGRAPSMSDLMTSIQANIDINKIIKIDEALEIVDAKEEFVEVNTSTDEQETITGEE